MSAVYKEMARANNVPGSETIVFANPGSPGVQWCLPTGTPCVNDGWEVVNGGLATTNVRESPVPVQHYISRAGVHLTTTAKLVIGSTVVRLVGLNESALIESLALETWDDEDMTFVYDLVELDLGIISNGTS